LNKLIVFLFLLPIFAGCGASDETANENENEELSTCHGFGSPSINVEVRDSITENIIDTAYVSIHLQDKGGSVFEAPYTSEEDGNSDSKQYAYWTIIEVNEGDFNFGVVVTEPNYHSFVIKNIQHIVDTSCNADNNVNYAVHLCLIGSSCL
jgi:hypothetical protein